MSSTGVADWVRFELLMRQRRKGKGGGERGELKTFTVLCAGGIQSARGFDAMHRLPSVVGGRFQS